MRLADSKHRFHKMRSIISALLPLAHKVAAGYNQSKLPFWTVVMAIDLSKAFDPVNHTKLIEAINATSLHHNIIRWLSAYLRGRIASYRYKDARSPCHAVRAGVPQGWVTSPLLLIFFSFQITSKSPIIVFIR